MENQKNFVPGLSGGTHVTNAVLTTELAEKASPGLLQHAIDKEIVKIRPMATPLDQISRLGHVRNVDAMEVDYYSVDTRNDRTSLLTVRQTGENEGVTECIITVDDPSIFEVSESVAWGDGEKGFLTGYISSKQETGELTLLTNADAGSLPAVGDILIRMGRAATQLDVQSPQFSVLPRKSTNYCQIFK